MISEGRPAAILALLHDAEHHINRAVEFNGEPACTTYMKLAKQDCEAAIRHSRLLDVPLPPEAEAEADSGKA